MSQENRPNRAANKLHSPDHVLEAMERLAKAVSNGKAYCCTVDLKQHPAETLPFPSESVDLVRSSNSIQHYPDFEKVLDEARRVLKKGDSLVTAISVAPEDDAIANWMNAIELRHDSSHVENYKISAIKQLLADHGFTVVENEYPRIYQRFNEWAARTSLSSKETEALRKDFLTAPDATREAFQVAPVHGDITFSWPCWVFQAVKD